MLFIPICDFTSATDATHASFTPLSTEIQYRIDLWNEYQTVNIFMYQRKKKREVKRWWQRYSYSHAQGRDRFKGETWLKIAFLLADDYAAIVQMTKEQQQWANEAASADKKWVLPLGTNCRSILMLLRICEAYGGFSWSNTMQCLEASLWRWLECP